MAKEIERKFLIVSNGWRKLAPGVHYRQGYLNSAKERTVRVRTVANQAFLTVKGPTVGVTRAEFEYSIPFEDAVAMLQGITALETCGCTKTGSALSSTRIFL